MPLIESSSMLITLNKKEKNVNLIDDKGVVSFKGVLPEVGIYKDEKVRS